MLRRTPPRHARTRWVAGQVVLVAVAVFSYFQVRGLTQTAPAVAYGHAHEVIHFEDALGIDLESPLQAPLLASATLETLANWVYIWGHWPVIVATLAWTAWLHPWAFRRLRDAMLVSGALGLLVFVSFPVAPPRLADPGLVDTVTAASRAYRVLQPPNFVNQYAAMPSLHAGWDLLVGITLATAATHRVVRIIGWVLPALMAYAVIGTANHYVVDVIAGVALALVGYAAALLNERRRQVRSRAP